MKFNCRLAKAAGFLLLPALLAVLPGDGRAQTGAPGLSITPQIHKDFPFQTMWDDALRLAGSSGKPVLAFDLDLVDSASIIAATQILQNKQLRAFISDRFEPALNDFAVDPPMSVGLDSLRVLGQRLSGLEKRYQLAVRPTFLILAPDGSEIDRIVYPDQMSPSQLRERLAEILDGKNTIASLIRDFWRDTNSVAAQEALINKFEEHGMYDSVVRHLESLRRVSDPAVSRQAAIRYAALRLQVEGETAPIRSIIAGLGSGDSALHFDLLQQLLQHFQRRKLTDSTLSVYEDLVRLTDRHDPAILNDYAWYVGGYTKDDAKALALIDEALRARPSDPDFLDTRALVLARMGRIDEAITIERRAYELAPDTDKPDFKESLDALKARKKALADERKPKSKSELKSKSK